ncbi:hypothetical protein Nans01_43720 [Nocardiopsis ansamitocini]|uniref:Uncharacterized protein n=1 Tax=Nocardiopsis ansamitocini TaxID=1670832 RepID=A0A9W6PAB9_9ACTN|nr:hypothetical protein Nans01_43720 [Nocardiopsis ansamitocini]
MRFLPASREHGSDFYDCILKTGLEPLPPLEDFLSMFDDLPETVAAAFAVQLRGSGEILGIASLRERDPAGHLKLGISMDVDKLPYGVGTEAMMLLVNYAFATWDDIRKVYIQTTDASMHRFKSSLSATPKEATFPKHVFLMGRLWDMHCYSISRESWKREGSVMLERLVNRGKRAARS